MLAPTCFDKGRLSIALLLLCCLAFCSSNAQSANDSVHVTGRILEETTDEPLIGAIVFLIKEEHLVVSGTATDENGYFELSVSKSVLQNAHLKISYSGFATKLISANTLRIPMVIKLAPEDADFDRAVIIIQCGPPMIDPFAPTQRTFDSYEIEKMAR